MTGDAVNGDKIKDVSHSELFIVGIGASAGGLEALRSMVAGLPKNSKLSYVVAQHLSPQHRSMLVSLLSKNSSVEVVEAKNGEKLQKDTVYITPPNKDIFVRNGCIELRKPTSLIGPKPSIDKFLESLADDIEENAVAIILSGTGTDGAHGVRAVKASGGLVMVQDEESAKYNGMPHAAMETGCVDIVVKPEYIGQELDDIFRKPGSVFIRSSEEDSLTELGRLLRIVQNSTGCDFSEYKSSTLCRRIERRITALKLSTLEEYLEVLNKNPKEVEVLLKNFLISVTSFFRDGDAYEELRNHICTLVEDKREEKHVRVWVPGCATGEEAYSIAILFAECLKSSIYEYNIQIFGTDIDNDALSHARKALYSEAAVAGVDEGILDKYFIQEENNYRVAKFIREMVIFARQDIVKDPPFSNLDLITCRNMLIYFTASLQKRIFPMFHYSLNSEGYLFLGKSESIGQNADLFSTVSKKWKIYRKKPVKSEFPVHVVPGSKTQAYVPQKSKGMDTKKTTMTDRMYKVLLDNFAPDSVLVSEDQTILHIFGDVSPYLKFTPGEASFNLFRMAREEINLELRGMLHKSMKEKVVLKSRTIRLNEDENELSFAVIVIPVMNQNGSDAEGYLVCFRRESSGSDKTEGVEASSGDSERVQELEQELAANKEHLQTVIEELETTNEELQALNEELHASNEELQSTNEELETSNEELQSTNEELITVNEELQVKTSELAEANTDLENILSSIEFPFLVLDKELKVKRFSPSTAMLYDISTRNIGHYYKTLGTKFELQGLSQIIAKALRGDKVEREFSTEESVYVLHVFPYYSSREEVEGIILAFLDVTKQNRLTDELSREKEFISTVMDTSPSGITVVDKHGAIIFANERSEEILGLSRDEIMSMRYNSEEWESGNYNGKEVKDDDLPFVRIMKSGESIYGMEERITRPSDGSQVYLRINGSPVFKSGQIDSVVFTLEDVTNFMETQKKLTDLNEGIQDRIDTEVDKQVRDESAQHQNSHFEGLGDMISSISHRWKQPLNAISLLVGYMEQLARNGELENIPEAAEKAAGHIDKLHSTMESYRKFYKISDKKTSFSALKGLEDVLEVVSEQLKSFRFVVHYNLGEESFERVLEKGEQFISDGSAGDELCIFGTDSVYRSMLYELFRRFVMFADTDTDIIIKLKSGGGSAELSIGTDSVNLGSEDLDEIKKSIEGVDTATTLYTSIRKLELDMDGKVDCTNDDGFFVKVSIPLEGSS